MIDDDAAVDAYLRGEIADQGLPGAAIAVIRDGQIDHLGGFGEADNSGRAMTPQTPVLVASLSKGFTALAVMQLVEAGKVDLSAPVQRYLPWFQVANPDDSARITVEELLHHTSGLPANDAPIFEQTGDDQDPASLEQGVRALAGIDLRDAPGGSFEYTNLGYNTLGEIVQTVSGQSYADYLQEHVFRPMQMQHTHTTIAAARQDGAAEGYYRWFRTTYRQTAFATPAAFQPSATTFSSAEDLAHEVVMYLHGGDYQGTPVIGGAAEHLLHTPAVAVGEDGAWYSMGWWVRPQWETSTRPGDPTADSATPQVIEHNGGWDNTHAHISYTPATGLGVVLLINANDVGGESRLVGIDRNVRNILLGQPATEPAPSEEFLTRYGWLVTIIVVVAQIDSWPGRSGS